MGQAKISSIMMMGPPGSGKGTQSARLCARFNIPHLAAGDILRDNVARQTPLGIAAKAKMANGELVPDDIIIDVMRQRLSDDDCRAGFLLDGFPRTVAQALALENDGIQLNIVVDLQADDDVIVQRLSGRMLHAASGRAYHRVFAPPKVADIDDITGEALTQREDDNPNVARRRLAVYRKQTAPLLSHYRAAAAAGGLRLIEQSAVADINSVAAELASRLRR